MNILSVRMAADEQNDYQNSMADDSSSSSVSQGYQQLTVSLTGMNTTTTNVTPPQLTLQQPTNRYGNRSAIYRSDAQQDIG